MTKAVAEDLEEASAAASDLMDWMFKGGFPPKGLTMPQALHFFRAVRKLHKEIRDVPTITNAQPV